MVYRKTLPFLANKGDMQLYKIKSLINLLIASKNILLACCLFLFLHNNKSVGQTYKAIYECVYTTDMEEQKKENDTSSFF